MGPTQLEAAARKAIAGQHGAKVSVTTGDDLLKEKITLIHAPSAAPPQQCATPDRHFTWGNESDPKVTLVGKGVCFDSGGLDIKPSSAMLLMKKDMGGAATVLALAHMIMSRGLKLRLRVLIPAVENAIGSDAFRPMDIYPSRKGLSVEIGNTDAEGHVSFSPTRSRSRTKRKPDLLIDMDTLTGAARVAGRSRSRAALHR